MSRPVFEPTSQREIRKNKFSADQLFRRPAPRSDEGTLPAVRIGGSDFTATDGAYYGLAQTTGANPSAFGVADQFEFFNDDADCTRAFSYKAVSAGYVIKLCAAAGGGDQDWMIAYDAGVIFDTSIDTTTVTASLYLGTGVGSGAYSWEFETLEAVMASNVSSTGTPTLRLTGTIPVTGNYPTNGTNRPTISPILLVEGANTDVTETWCYYTALTTLASTVFIPT